MSVSRFLEVAAYYAGYGAAFNGKIRLSPFDAADRPDDHDAWLRGFDDARAVMARNVAVPSGGTLDRPQRRGR